MARLKTAVLISGRGSNLQALIDACAASRAPAEIVLVMSNVPGAPGLDRARAAGIATETIDHCDFRDRESFEDRVTSALVKAGAQLVCLAGFMRLLTPGFVERWRDRLINIHPSLLPAYRGLDTHARAIADGVRFAGCTVHFVRPEMDAGPIIVQAAVPIRDDDDATSLAARVLVAEHRCYPLALRLIAEGRIRIENEKVLIDGGFRPVATVLNPDDGAVTPDA
jgi:phosphoribosylglycinamide formyltransferase-1